MCEASILYSQEPLVPGFGLKKENLKSFLINMKYPNLPYKNLIKDLTAYYNMYINSLFCMNEQAFRQKDRSLISNLDKYKIIRSQKLKLSVLCPSIRTDRSINEGKRKKENVPLRLPSIGSYSRPRVRSQMNQSVHVLNSIHIDPLRKRREVSYFTGEDQGKTDQASQANFDL